MIDWLSCCARLTHEGRIHGGHVVVINPDGEVEWQRPRGFQVEGSFDARVMVRSHDQFPHYVHVSGNPSKFLQGHNVFGSNDLRGLAFDFLRRVVAALGIEPTAADLADWRRGNIGVSLVDVTESWRFESRGQVRSALRVLEQHARLAHRGRGTLTKESTLYWGKNSRRWALKAYCKGDELQAGKHRLHDRLPLRDEVEAFADNLLRFELRMFGQELERHQLATVGHWRDNTGSELHQAAMSKLEISEAAILKPELLEGLSPRLQLAYQAWLEGHDLRAILPRKTFYRYRKQLQAHGVDIALKRPRTSEASNVIPLRIVLHGYPVGVPDWARGTAVYYEPERLKVA